MATNQQLAKLHILYKELKLEAQKEALVYSFTAGRGTSSKDLTNGEAAEMIEHLAGLVEPGSNDSQRAEVMKRKIIAMAHNIGWKVPSSGKIDIGRLNGWCMHFGKFKKPLDQHSYQELPVLVSQFQKGPYQDKGKE